MENESGINCCEIEITDVTLLPAKDADTVKKCAGKGSENIWYCLGDADTIALVNARGKSFEWPVGCDYLWSGVRPVLKFSNAEGKEIGIGERFRIAGHTFTVVSEGTALCDELIFHKALTLSEVKAAKIPGFPQEPDPGEEEKIEILKKFPQDNPCTMDGIENILSQWIEKSNIKASAFSRRNTVEIVK